MSQLSEQDHTETPLSPAAQAKIMATLLAKMFVPLVAGAGTTTFLYMHGLDFPLSMGIGAYSWGAISANGYAEYYEGNTNASWMRRVGTHAIAIAISLIAAAEIRAHGGDPVIAYTLLGLGGGFLSEAANNYDPSLGDDTDTTQI